MMPTEARLIQLEATCKQCLVGLKGWHVARGKKDSFEQAGDLAVGKYDSLIGPSFSQALHLPSQGRSIQCLR